MLKKYLVTLDRVQCSKKHSHISRRADIARMPRLWYENVFYNARLWVASIFGNVLSYRACNEMVGQKGPPRVFPGPAHCPIYESGGATCDMYAQKSNMHILLAFQGFALQKPKFCQRPGKHAVLFKTQPIRTRFVIFSLTIAFIFGVRMVSHAVRTKLAGATNNAHFTARHQASGTKVPGRHQA